MVESVSQVAAREALSGRKGGARMAHKEALFMLDCKSEAEGQMGKRFVTRRGRNRQRKKKKEVNYKDYVEDALDKGQQDEVIGNGIIYDLDFERCKSMVSLPTETCQLPSSPDVRRRSTGNCYHNERNPYRRPQPILLSDAIVKVEEMALDVNKSEKRKMRRVKKSELIRLGQSGWAGACFDRSPSPSLLPMPPSILLERACCAMHNSGRDSSEAHSLSSED